MITRRTASCDLATDVQDDERYVKRNACAVMKSRIPAPHALRITLHEFVTATVLVALVSVGPGTAAETPLRNPAHEKLAAMSEVDRSELLAVFVEGSGQSCRIVARTFFQGLDSRGNAIWNVECAGGQSYVVEVKNDRN